MLKHHCSLFYSLPLLVRPSNGDNDSKANPGYFQALSLNLAEQSHTAKGLKTQTHGLVDTSPLDSDLIMHFFFFFLNWLQPQHVQVLRAGTETEPQLWATLDPLTHCTGPGFEPTATQTTTVGFLTHCHTARTPIICIF